MSIDIKKKMVVLDDLYPNYPRELEGDVVTVYDIAAGFENTPLDLSGIDYEVEYNRIILEKLRNEKKKQINVLREIKLNANMPYTFNGVQDTIQIREKDKIILLGLAIKASKMISQTNEPVIEFRSGNDNKYMLTPTEALTLTTQANSYIESVYKESWVYKEQIKNAQTVEELYAIQWVV